MSTTLAKAGKVERKWYVIDAAGKPLGRVAATAAVLLRGKNKVTFTPNVDCGDHVIIINCADAVLMAERSDFAMKEAVRGMLPGNTLGAAALKRLRVYKGAEHSNAAQKPEAYTL